MSLARVVSPSHAKPQSRVNLAMARKVDESRVPLAHQVETAFLNPQPVVSNTYFKELGPLPSTVPNTAQSQTHSSTSPLSNPTTFQGRLEVTLRKLFENVKNDADFYDIWKIPAAVDNLPRQNFSSGDGTSPPEETWFYFYSFLHVRCTFLRLYALILDPHSASASWLSVPADSKQAILPPNIYYHPAQSLGQAAYQSFLRLVTPSLETPDTRHTRARDILRRAAVDPVPSSVCSHGKPFEAVIRDLWNHALQCHLDEVRCHQSKWCLTYQEFKDRSIRSAVQSDVTSAEAQTVNITMDDSLADNESSAYYNDGQNESDENEDHGEGEDDGCAQEYEEDEEDIEGQTKVPEAHGLTPPPSALPSSNLFLPDIGTSSPHVPHEAKRAQTLEQYYDYVHRTYESEFLSRNVGWLPPTYGRVESIFIDSSLADIDEVPKASKKVRHPDTLSDEVQHYIHYSNCFMPAWWTQATQELSEVSLSVKHKETKNPDDGNVIRGEWQWTYDEKSGTIRCPRDIFDYILSVMHQFRRYRFISHAKEHSDAFKRECYRLKLTAPDAALSPRDSITRAETEIAGRMAGYCKVRESELSVLRKTRSISIDNFGEVVKTRNTIALSLKVPQFPPPLPPQTALQLSMPRAEEYINSTFAKGVVRRFEFVTLCEFLAEKASEAQAADDIKTFMTPLDHLIASLALKCYSVWDKNIAFNVCRGTEDVCFSFADVVRELGKDENTFDQSNVEANYLVTNYAYLFYTMVKWFSLPYLEISLNRESEPTTSSPPSSLSTSQSISIPTATRPTLTTTSVASSSSMPTNTNPVSVASLKNRPRVIHRGPTVAFDNGFFTIVPTTRTPFTMGFEKLPKGYYANSRQWIVE